MQDPTAPDPIDELLAACLCDPDPAAAVDTAIRDHPELAAELRRRWEFLVANRAPGTTAPIGVATRLGRFRLLEKVGGGGMGVVYRAVEEPLGREVAIKLVRPEHLWFEGAQKRFLREMELVATVQHPGIVPVYSCGEQDGVPFCAMEYVRGQSLGALLAELRQRNAPPDVAALHQTGARGWTDACFRVVLQVAEALAHVHERGIVHRDVKPSNILLEPDGRARLIDFGLARGGATESMTRTGVQPGSLAYMSPEQVRGEPVDARTDVWSLGVTLLELIALRQPFLAANEELTRRAILSGTSADAMRSSTRLPWDAATVIGTAMAPERERRYRSMAAFAADLRAFLERRPIAARRPGAILRLRRWVERRPGAAALTALLVALFGILPTTLLLRERAARQEIEREAATAKRVVCFLEELFYEVDPSRARGETVPARVVLDRGVHQIRSELADEPGVRAALLQAMGIVYMNLGLLGQAEELIVECLAIRERSLPADRAALRTAQRVLTRIQLYEGRTADAERSARSLLADERDSVSGRAETLLHLAQVLMRQDRVEESLRVHDEAIALLSAQPGDERLLLDARRGRAELLLERLDPQRALAELRDVEQASRRLLGENDPRLFWTTFALAEAELENGDPAAAETLLRAAVPGATKVFDKFHPTLAAMREGTAEALMLREQPAAALRELGLALEAYLATYRRPHPVIARAHNLESSLAYECGNYARAERAARAALAEFEALPDRSSHDHALALGNLSRVLLMLGSWGEARDLAARAVRLLRDVGSMRSELLAYNEAYLAYAQALLGDVEAAKHAAEARALLADSRDLRARGNVGCYTAEVALLTNRGDEALALARAAEQDWTTFGSTQGADWARFVQGWAENARGKAAEAEQLLRPVLERQQQSAPAGHPYTARTACELAVALCRQSKFEEGIALLQQAIAALRQALGDDSRLLPLPTLNLGMALYRRQRPADAVEHGLEALRILGSHGSAGDRLVGPGIKLVMVALPGIEDTDKRRAGWLRLRELAQPLLPAGDEQLAAIERALGGR